MAHKLILEFAEDGTYQVKVEGVAGSGCKAVTKDIEEALGKVTESKPTNEMYQQAKQQKGIGR